MHAQGRQSSKPSARTGMRRRIRTVLVMVMAVTVWGGIQWFEQHQEVQAKVQQLELLQQKLEATKKLNEQYKLDIMRMEDPEYIEQLLRKELHMTKEGEKLFIKTN